MRLRFATLAALGACQTSTAPETVDAGGLVDSGWACELAPVPLPIPSAGAAHVDFDVPLPGVVRNDFYVLRMFRSGADVIVFGQLSAYRVTVDGTVTTSTYAPTDPTSIELTAVAEGLSTYGALMMVTPGDGTQHLQFCALDSSGDAAGAPCVTLDAFGVVAFDGTDYRVYAIQNGFMRRWIIDESATVLSVSILWDASHGDSAAAGALASADQELIFTTGWRADGDLCPTINEHRLVGTSHTSRTVFPAGIATGPFEGHFRLAGSLDGTALTLNGGACVSSNDQCRPEPAYATSYILSAYANGTLLGDHPVPLALQGDDTIFASGDSMVVAYAGPDGLLLSRFASDGAVELSALRVPATSGPVWAGLALAANEYALVYTGSNSMTYIVRFTY